MFHLHDGALFYSLSLYIYTQIFIFYLYVNIYVHIFEHDVKPLGNEDE